MKRFLLIAFLLCAVSVRAQKLEKRADRFAALVTDVDVPEVRYVKRLARYFDPEQNADSIAQAHYDWWKRYRETGSYSVSREIKAIEYPSETRGLVTMETVWHYPGGEEVLFVIQTRWVRRGRNWYRMEEQQKTLDSRLLN